ncbi:MAG: polysaccharide biosynthesis protein [Planctomycetota bacterium]
MFEGKTLLVTGGTGSFGNEILRHFLRTPVREIRVFSRDEKKQEDMRIAINDSKVKFYIGDVRQYDSVYEAMHGVDYVFHAAALKQVPSCEFYPMEAIRTNVLGADNVMNAAIARGVQRMVFLSTDKAVYPINAMGLSKAMMEKVMIAKSRMRAEGETVLCATRYGNVMASRGSVIPLFISQIKAGKPVTITDPSMTRFLMSLKDSVQVVLHAYEHAQQGDIFVQKAPAATLDVLARALIRIFGGKGDIRIIGTRHGEKLFESLVSREEMAKASDDEQYYRIPADNRDLNYAKYFVEGETTVSTTEDYTSHNTHRLSEDETIALLLKLDYIQEQLNA